LPVPEGDKEWYLYAARAGLPLGVASHRSFVSLSTIARREGSKKSARAATIFIHNGAPQALVGCHACSPFPGATKNGTSMQRGPDCYTGSYATAVLSASARSPVAKAPTNRPAPPPFSSIMARRRRWLAATCCAPICHENSLSVDAGHAGSAFCSRVTL